MNDLEKAKEIADGYSTNSRGMMPIRLVKQEIKQSCLEMAQWKDEQLDSAIDKSLQRNGDFLKQGKITQYGYDIAFCTIQNIREYLKQ